MDRQYRRRHFKLPQLQSQHILRAKGKPDLAGSSDPTFRGDRSRYNPKERTINPEPTQLGELMVDVVSKYKLLAKKRGVSINTLVTGDLPLVYVDIALIDRVFQNIIDNALRHTEEGDVIHLEINPGAKHVEVRISDTGEGIKEVELPHIFDRYKRGRATGEGGGLGLAIVKKILELHEAPISVASKLTFRFELPVYQGAT
jgi:signal transduction histidine kinase